jgi:hypothetical protein
MSAQRTKATDSSAEPPEPGKGGKGGDFEITNADFIAAVFPSLPEGAFVAVSSKGGDPDGGGWHAGHDGRGGGGYFNRATTMEDPSVAVIHNLILALTMLCPIEWGSCTKF